MKIYRGAIEILEFTSDGREFRDLDTHEHSLSFNFELDTYVELKKGDRISYNGKNFYLPKDVIVAKNKETDGYRYELTFYDIIKRFDDFIVIFDGNTDFTLNTTGTNHLKLISDNLIDKGIGSFDYSSNSEVKAIHYENLTILEALDLIAETYDLEWWVNGDVLNLGICEFGEPIILEYDKELDDISFSEASERMITRLYVFGGTRNMFYGKRLTLPSDYPYVDLFPNLPSEQIVEGVKIFDDIYPRQENTITEITSSVIYPTDRDQQATTIYTFKCSGINITRDDLLPGESLKMAFTSGQLNGREFELYIRKNGYEIIYKQEGDNYFPNPILRPQVGDTFFFFGFKAETIMPELVTNAQNELLSAAQDYMDSLGMDYVFDVKTRSIYCEENNIDLDIGQVVTLESDYLGSITSRIRGYEKDINNVFDATYSIGNYSRYSRIGAIESETGKKVDRTEVISVTDNLDALNRFSEWWKYDEENDAIYSDLSVYSKKEISAYGVGSGTGGGGGTGYERLDAWADYDSSKSGWVLSAFLGKDLDTRVETNSSSISDLNQRVDAIEGVDSDKNFVYTQGVPSDTWTINHTLNKYPSVTIIDSGGTEVIGNIKYIDTSTVIVTFASGFSGKAILN
jgi:hypothetical protein